MQLKPVSSLLGQMSSEKRPVEACAGVTRHRHCVEKGTTGNGPEDYLGNSYLKRGLREWDLRNDVIFFQQILTELGTPLPDTHIPVTAPQSAHLVRDI